MSDIDDIVSSIPMDQLAERLGVDQATAQQAVRQAVPALLGGLHANAQDPSGAASLIGALSDHSPTLVDGGINLDQVDTGDGQKIVGNIFGGNQDQVAATLGGNLGGQQALMQKLLPILAPIVLSYLAKRMQGGKLGSLLGPLLAGAAGGTGGSGGNAITDILEHMLGGSAAPAAAQTQAEPASSGHPILDMLGGLLGGGRR